jgi:predicted phage-related endonuclease
MSDRNSWLKTRRIGSSDAPGLWGLGYASQSLYAMWASKARGVETEWSPADLRRLALGKAAEPVIREWFAEEIGLPIEHDGEYVTRICEEHPFMSASLDGWLMHPEYGLCPVELKKVGYHNRSDWYTQDGLPVSPMRYQVQLGHQMIVTGATHGYLVGLIGDDDLQWRLVELSPAFAAQHVSLCREFWRCVEDDTPPQVDGSAATAAALARLWPESTPGVVVDLPAEADGWTEEIEHLSASIKTLEERREAARNALRSALGDAEQGVTPAGAVWSWRTQERKEYTVAAGSSRVLRRVGNRSRKKGDA